jgi:replicative DNA helicase
MKAGELIVLAARPGVGKSAAALLYATACEIAGRVPLFFSLEMSKAELWARLAVQIAGNHHEQNTVPVAKTLPKKKYRIYDVRAAHSIAQIEARARLAATSCDVGLIVIDYLQLVTPPQDMKGSNREQQVSAMTRRFKLLAGELKVPVLLLSQMSREVEKDDRMPRLSDLRESGSIEQDADAVWFLHRDMDLTEQRIDGQQVLKAIQAKRRNFGPAMMDFAFNGKNLRFTPIQY